MNNNPFVDLETLCLRKSSRSNKGKAHKRFINKMLTLSLAVFVNPITLATDTTSHFYQGRVVEYEDYLENNFNRSTNTTCPLVHIYLNPMLTTKHIH